MSSAQHNASTPLLRLPLEIKNQIYKYTFGGNLIHIIQKHDKDGRTFKSYICCASISEEEAQENFDSESTHPWYAPANEGRHDSCHGFDGNIELHQRPDALSLSPLRSCRQVYNEAHHIPYSANTFGCFNPKTLQSFVTSLAQGSKDNQLAVRSLFLEMDFTVESDMSLWKKAVATCAKRLTALQNVSISIDWGSFYLILASRLSFPDADLEKDRLRQMISSILTLKKLPLKTATIVISDREAEHCRDHWCNNRDFWINQEDKYRWTLDEKKERARYVREVLLRSQM